MIKKYILFIFLTVVSFSCNRDWDNPLEVDEDLKNAPEIFQIQINSELNIEIHLDYGYSDECVIILERKTIGGFSQISYLKQNQSTLVDTSFDKESDYNFTYRVRIKKNQYYTAHSNEEPFNYVSNVLYAPGELQARTLELQGVQLTWNDISGKETGYKIEKDEGSGYFEIASLAANSNSYLDEITGVPEITMQLSYRVKAFTGTLSSEWMEIEASYSGLGSPTDLRIIDTNTFQFTIEWEDNSNIETSYSVERQKDDDIYEVVAELDANVTEYKDFITELGVYTYRVQAQNDDLYSAYSNEVSYNITKFVIVDIDNNVYQAVKIGDQWWIAENLKVTHYRNGDAIPNVTDATEWSNLTTGAYCNYDNNSSNADTYGRFYNWYAVNDSRNIAPEGWHVPSDAEWKTLEMYLGMSQSEADAEEWRGTDEGGKLKETGTMHWNSPNVATNESGFSALPGGCRYYDGSYDYMGSVARFWSSTEYGSYYAWRRSLHYDLSEVYRYYDFSKGYGLSVRYVRY